MPTNNHRQTWHSTGAQGLGGPAIPYKSKTPELALPGLLEWEVYVSCDSLSWCSSPA
jgi:hypothetical protein